MPHKQMRVLSPDLLEALGRTSVIALSPADPSSWRPVDAMLHKISDDPGLLGALERFAEENPSVAVIDPPAAVRRVQRRDTMLEPLQAPGGLTLPPPPLPSPAGAAGPGSEGAPATGLPCTCCWRAAAPPQAVVEAGASTSEALAAMRAAGVGFPCLVKPLSTTPTAPAEHPQSTGSRTGAEAAGSPSVSTGGHGPSEGAAADAGRRPQPPWRGPPSSPAAAEARLGGQEANHSMGVCLGAEGVTQVVSGAVPALAPPVVLQQFVPHGPLLIKVYVIGDEVVVEERATLTAQQLSLLAAQQRCAAEGRGGGGGAELLLLSGRPSSLPGPPAQEGGGAVGSGAEGASTGRAAGSERLPPLWALKQLAAQLRSALGLTLFNFDVILPECNGEDAREIVGGFEEDIISHGIDYEGHHLGICTSLVCHERQLLIVVDVNFFPGFDKLAGGQRLLGRYLASRTQAAAARLTPAKTR